MEFKEIAKGVKIPVVGLGTWGMGGGTFPNHFTDKRSIAALRHGIKLGMTHIDTAEMYANGHTEEVVSEAIKPFDREKLFITSKVLPRNFRYNDVIEAAKRSLKRLKIKQMDLYLLHWPNPDIPLKETMRAMEYLLEQELTKFIGVSNFSVEEMKEAQSYLDGAKIVTNQVEYSLLEREPEKELIPFCRKNKIIFTAYSPLGHGKLVKKKILLLGVLSKKYNKTPAQIALNWLISKDSVITIPKASNINHVEENAGAVGWKLEKSDMEQLDKFRL
ncbi:MAG: aldo/keto reductase [Candidatus Aenigmarchaeota archaeon]|nr:aldo/keto reductase [Candidatus Aenigmarchaeota archaeon]